MSFLCSVALCKGGTGFSDHENFSRVPVILYRILFCVTEYHRSLCKMNIKLLNALHYIVVWCLFCPKRLYMTSEKIKWRQIQMNLIAIPYFFNLVLQHALCKAPILYTWLGLIQKILTCSYILNTERKARKLELVLCLAFVLVWQVHNLPYSRGMLYQFIHCATGLGNSATSLIHSLSTVQFWIKWVNRVCQNCW